MTKLKVFVCSSSIPAVGFVDKETAVHEQCVGYAIRSRAQETAFEGLKRVSGIVGNRYLSDEDLETLKRVEEFCNSNGLEFEVVDVGAMNFIQKLQLRLRGVRAPAVSYGDKIFLGVPSEEDLTKILEERML